MSKKIVYFDPNFDIDDWGTPTEFSHSDIMAVLAEKYENGLNAVHIYDTIEDFLEAFNNDYISDAGYAMVFDIEPKVQIFKEHEAVSEGERKLIAEVGLAKWCVDSANDLTAFELTGGNSLADADDLVDRLNSLSDTENWYLGNPYEEYVNVF